MDSDAESLEDMYNDAPPLIQQMFDWLAEGNEGVFVPVLEEE